MKIRNTSFTPLCFSSVFENYKERFYHSINAIEHSFDSQYIFLFIGLICLYTCLCLCLSFCLDYFFVLLNFWTSRLQKNIKLLFNENKKHIIYSTLFLRSIWKLLFEIHKARINCSIIVVINSFIPNTIAYLSISSVYLPVWTYAFLVYFVFFFWSRQEFSTSVVHVLDNLSPSCFRTIKWCIIDKLLNSNIAWWCLWMYLQLGIDA